jgi:PAS domain S-box-containing protein
MKIRGKVLILIGLTMLTLIAILYVASEEIMLGGIGESEKADAESNAMRFMKNLDIEFQRLDSTVQDWAAWDDTYIFVESNSTDYVESNLADETFVNLKVNMMLFLNPARQLIFGKVFDLSNATTVELRDTLVREISINDFLFTNDIDHAEKGIALLEGIPMIIASYPILTSMNEGPIRGTMVIGRYFDDSKLDDFADVIGLPLTTFTLSQTHMPADFQLANASLSTNKPFFSHVLDETHIAGYALINDVTGNPALIVRVESYRAAYVQGKTSVFYTSISFVAIGITAIAVTAALLEKLVLSRLSRLSDDVGKISPSDDQLTPVALNGQDELSGLAAKINKMLEAIHESRQALKKHAENLENKVDERTRQVTANQAKLKSILDASPDTIIATDLEGNILEVNGQVYELYGYNISDLHGKSAFSFIAENDVQRVLEHLSTVLNSGVTVNAECTLVKMNKSRFPVDLSIGLVRSGEGNPIGFVAIIRDITEKREIQQRLLKAERFAAIGELAGMVGHDLRNPLTGIKNAAYYLKKKNVCTEAKGKEMLDIVDNAVEHANRIVNDLLDYSREIRLELEERTPQSLVKEALSSIQIPDRIKILDYSLDDPKMNVDPSRIMRVLVNLINNAIDAMPKAGTLEIRSTQKNGNVEISFVDSGPGIPEEIIPKLFTPLFTTKAQGMGFGLAICKRIVEAHGGKITVESEQDKGTTFTIVLPVEPKIEVGGGKIWINMQESSLSTTMKTYKKQ